MVNIPKSANFRSVYAGGVYAFPSETEVRFIFISNEPVSVDTGQDQQGATFSVAPHIQAEIVMNRDLARWIRDFLNEYLGQPEVPRQ